MVFTKLMRRFGRQKNKNHEPRFRKRDIFLGAASVFFLLVSGGLLWAASLEIPDISSFESREIVESTKIYDRTGEILLYDVHGNIQRTLVEGDEMSEYIRNATVAIEDQGFYSHFGVEPSAIVRAALANIRAGEIVQGGSTITQQVIKNALLTSEQLFTRKIKEAVLAIKLEQIYEKDEILTFYLNEIPYGGSLYGIEEAAQAYFGKSADDLELVESAYLAALPQAPTYYLNNPDALESRKDTVLRRMRQNNYITEEEFNEAMEKEIAFSPANLSDDGIKAPHFVMYILQYLEQEYGTDVVNKGGLKVITTLDYELQKKFEQEVYEYSHQIEETFDAENAAAVATDPETGEILAMIGSRDYSDDSIDGQVNVATSPRQPGSTFKPFVYATAFEEGYTPETLLFNLRTQFSTSCSPRAVTESEGGCFSPQNYNGEYTGPMTMRNALAQSVNVVAVKTLYLAGIRDSIQTAHDMGISTLDPDRTYGLSLVLGSGEVKLLEMTNAYGTFANGGMYHEPVSILRVEDREGEVLEEFDPEEDLDGERAVERNAALQVTDILTDNTARTPAFGANSPLYFADGDVAVKTGTTNNYVDVWTLGYTTDIAIGVWAGNNNSDPIEKRVAGYVITPLWRTLMEIARENEEYEGSDFPEPNFAYSCSKPILCGSLMGGMTTEIEGEEVVIDEGVRSILYWVEKENPRGPRPAQPGRDPQFAYWEYPVSLWAGGSSDGESDDNDSEIDVDGLDDEYNENESIEFSVEAPEGTEEIVIFIDDEEVADENDDEAEFSFDADDFGEGEHTLTVEIEGEDDMEESFSFSIE